MKRILTGIFFLISAGSIPLQAQHVIDDPVPISMPVAPARLSPDEILARADSLHRAYCFEDAIGLYLSLGEEKKAAASQHALNMTDFCADPHVVARQRFSRKDFFLYYPLEPHAWHAAPNPLDSLEGYPLYYPKGADILYFSAADRSGSRSLFVTENLDSLWRAPRPVGEGQLSMGSEIFPMLSPDGKTLYFASDGLIGMGGFDLYSSAWDEESGTWGEPVNMGFPFSSPADDFLLVDTADGKYTLFASNRDCSRDSVY
ncbi:MAG: PD40 domain-containing protein, partial [Bacteroidales bacterium]|nr:PD40 domain-containing protein [Bacteroidales bacterium]